MRIRCDGAGCVDGQIRVAFRWPDGEISEWRSIDCPKCHGTGVIRAADEDTEFMDEPYSEEERKAQDDERWSREER